MRIERMFLQRYCQHVEREVEFCPGMNVIIGPIGSGKSNILKAIRFAFTNDSGNSGTKEEDITFGSAPGDRSGVQLSGVHQDKRFILRRFLRPNSRELSWQHTGNSIKADKAIAVELQTQLGIDPSLFDDFVIVPQGRMADIIDMSDAARTDTMHGLVGLHKYMKIYSWLGSYLTSIPAATELISVEDATDRIKKLEDDKAKWQQVIADTQMELPSAEAVIAAQKLLADKALIQSLKLSITEDELTIFNTEESLAKHVIWLKQVDDYVASLQTAYTSTKDSLAKLSEQVEQAKLYERRKKLLASIEAGSIKPPQPVKPDSYIEVGADKIAAVRQSLAVALHLQNLLKSGATACPSCFRPVKDTAITNAVDNIPNLQKWVQEYDSTVALSRQFDNDMAKWNATVTALEASLPALRLELESIPETPAPDKTLAQLEALLNSGAQQLVQVQLQLDDWLPKKSTGDQTKSSMEAALSLTRQRLAKSKSELESLKGGSELEAIEAQELVDKVSALELRIAGAKGSLAVVEKTIPEEQAIYTKAVQQREKYEKNMKFRADVATCRTIFQRDNLPTELAKNGMLALAAQMNMSLSAFSANFRVSAGSGSTFQVSFFADGVKGNQPEARLSGGERAQFGLALRVAVHSLWAQELGFLAMDEPTYGFGQNDMGCVKIAIEQLRDMSRAQGLQVIVVTHEKSLLPLFDHVIRIGM